MPSQGVELKSKLVLFTGFGSEGGHLREVAPETWGYVTRGSNWKRDSHAPVFAGRNIHLHQAGQLMHLFQIEGGVVHIDESINFAELIDTLQFAGNSRTYVLA
jgi:hypothetical protein